MFVGTQMSVWVVVYQTIVVVVVIVVFTRIFVCENVPQLKYHNPKLKVSVNVGKDTLTSPSIKFKTSKST